MVIIVNPSGCPHQRRGWGFDGVDGVPMIRKTIAGQMLVPGIPFQQAPASVNLRRGPHE